MCAVYLIRCGAAGPAKIGFSSDPVTRRNELQVAHWDELYLLRTWEGGVADEIAVQARFEDLRLRGDWFSWSRAMLGDVGLVEISAPEPPLEIPEFAVSINDVLVGRVLRERLRAANMTQDEAAKACGAHQAVFSRYCRGERRIPAHQAPKISQSLNIPLYELRPDLWPAPAQEAAA